MNLRIILEYIIFYVKMVSDLKVFKGIYLTFSFVLFCQSVVLLI